MGVVVGGEEAGGWLGGVRVVGDCGSQHEDVVVERGEVLETKEVIVDGRERNCGTEGMGRGLQVCFTLGKGVAHESGVLEGEQGSLQ